MANKSSAKNPEKTVDVPPYGDRNPDPITDSPGSHPVETGVGAALGGAASGAALGVVAGPLGAMAGAVIGAVAGGLAGKGVGELIDPTTEDNWIREYFDEDERHATTADKTVVSTGEACSVGTAKSKSKSTAKSDSAVVESYRVPYYYGLDAGKRHAGRSFTEVEPELERDWHAHRGDSGLDWSDARPAAEKAFGKSVELHAEKLKVGKTKKTVGQVDVHTEVHTEHKTITVPVEREEVVIERRHVGDKSAGDFKIGKYATEEIRIPVSKEEVHVSKETVVTDEVTVGKRKVVDTKTVEADVKHEELEVDAEGETCVKDSKKKR